MSIKEGVVQSLIRSDPQHRGLVGRNYTLIVLTAHEAITSLFTIWDPLATVQQRAATHPLPKAAAMASAFICDVPVLISACPRSLGQANWTTTATSPGDLVILEGNHRMQAVALRASWTMPLPSCIGVFVQL